MSKLTNIAAGLVAVPVLAISATAIADSPGQLQGGANTYLVKNVTQSGSYATTATAGACEELKYSVELHNTEFGKLSNINVTATLPSAAGTSVVSNATATATNSAGTAVNTTGSTTVTLSSSQTVSYEAGSTALYDGSANLIKALPDGITAGGVNAGDLNGSTTEFVTFKVKVNCPPTTPPTQIQVCDLTTKKVITINESDFNASKHSKDLTKCATPAAPTKLVNTGPGQVAGLFAAVTVAAAAARSLFVARRVRG